MAHLLHYLVIFCLWLLSFQIPKWEKNQLVSTASIIEQERQSFEYQAKDKSVYQCTKTLFDFKY